MPWDAASFHKHNRSLSDAQSGHAALIANAILRRTGDEGLAIATANARARASGGLIPRFQDGGTPISAPTPSAQTVGNPMTSGYLQQLSTMPPDQLRALIMRTQGSPISQMAQTVLQKKLLMPNAAGAAPQPPVPAPTPIMPPPQAPPQGMMATGAPMAPAAPSAPYSALASGGHVRGYDSGGGLSMSMMSPWWTRSEAREADSTAYYRGATGGRADQVNAAPPAGSYVLPADVVAGWGQGNNDAGARVIENALSTYPYGTHQATRPRGSAYGRPPPPPHDPGLMRGIEAESRGGKTGNVPIRVSHGEVLVLPETVRRLGGGNLKAGHKLLDQFVEKSRAHHIKELKKLPGPVKK